MLTAVRQDPALLLPVYWPVWLGYFLLILIVYLPHPARLSIGRGLGSLALRLAKSRRHIVEVNVAQCFPELSHDEKLALIRRIFESGGISIIETAIAWIRGSGAIESACVEIEGLEHLHAARAGGQGVLLLGSHMSTLDLAGTFLADAVPFIPMYRKNPNRLMDAIMLRGRERSYPRAIERNDIKGVIRALKQGDIVWYGPDQDYGTRNAVFTPFFDVQAATLTAVPRICRITGARVVPYSHVRLDGGQRYRLVLEPAWENCPGDSEEADARRINEHVESVVRQAPEQYWWFHRRFKSRPPGEPSLY